MPCSGQRVRENARQERQHVQSLADVIARHSLSAVAAAVGRKKDAEHGEHVRSNLVSAMCVLQRTVRRFLARKKLNELRAQQR